MQISMIDIHDTTVKRIHEQICDTAVEIGNAEISVETRIPKKFRGPALRNGAPYNEGKLVLMIADEYSSAPDKTRQIYRAIATQSLKSALIRHKDLFAGMILGEAKAGRNYFDQWPQTPVTLF